LEGRPETHQQRHVVGIGARCGLRARRADQEHSRSFSVSEFVRLAGGERLTLHEDRGFTIGLKASSGDVAFDEFRGQEALASLTRDVLTAVLPDDDGCGEDHPWAWLTELARSRGLDVAEDDLRGLTYEVLFTDEVRRWLGMA
jgi:hypothetical protein